MAELDGLLESPVELTKPPIIEETLANSRVTMPPPVTILGVPFAPISTSETLGCIHRMIASGRSHYMVTANVDFLVQAREDEELRRILVDADLVVCDGTPLLWVSRLLGNPLPERVAGADLVPELIRHAADKGYRLFFLGGKPEVAAAAVGRLRERYPALQTDHYSPPYSSLLEMDQREIRRRIRRFNPDVLLVSFGCPKAEKWMAMNHAVLRVPVSIGVGATIDFLAGTVKRAPLRMQRMGLEWLFRLAQEPRRLVKRYWKDLRTFGIAVGQQWWVVQGFKTKPRRANSSRSVMIEPDWHRIEATEHWDVRVATVEDCVWRSQRPRHLILDLARVRCIDSTGIGLMLRWRKQQQDVGRQLILLNPSPVVNRALQDLGLAPFFLTALDALEARRCIQAVEEQAAGLVMAPVPRHNQPWLWQGNITVKNAARVAQRTLRILQSYFAYSQPLVIDLSAVEYIDTTGARFLQLLKCYAQAHGVHLRVVGTTRTVQQVLRMSGVAKSLVR